MQTFWWIVSFIVAIVVVWLIWEEFISDKDEGEAEAKADNDSGESATAIEALAPRPEAAEEASVQVQERTAAVALEGATTAEGATAAVAVAAATSEASETESEPDEQAADDGEAAATATAEATATAGEATAAAVAVVEEAEAESTEAEGAVAADATRTAAAVDIGEPSSYPDNLTLVKGIGKVYQRRLYDSGIYTWHQVTASDVDDLREISSAIDAANVHDWPRQASLLAKKYDREGATYAGDSPDDLTRVGGIGQAGVQRLYQAGIVTFAQMAAASPGQLSAALGSGDEPAKGDFDAMIAQAGELAGA
jgi:predicted flap endonuclease-1-like 5' DNA nuclease